LEHDATIHAPDAFAGIIKQLGAKKAKLRIDAHHTPARVLDMCDDAGALIDIGADICDLPKACKNRIELAGIKAAHIRDGLALTKFLCWLDGQPAGSVNEIAAEEKLLEFRKTAPGFLYPSFPSISGAGPHGAIVHYRRQHLWAQGLDYDHGTGHGVGAFLGVHEGPQSISGRSTVPLRAGMVISNEPGYYLAGAYGIRIENLVFVKETANKLDGKATLEFETLTLAPMDNRLVDVALLTAPEKEWLNAYHANVYETHAPHLNEAEQHWLKLATSAL
ncbi:MAG: M24 family metallopeptidase, partial [Alphaproteobacteria bacterium]|nr:M24 family metallopeptidase [Alphaproteobacteria bacterium]